MIKFDGSNEESIDPLVGPLCSWLNSFRGVHTIFSCQGHEEKGETSGYVAFYLDSYEYFENIVRAIDPFSFEGSVNGKFVKIYISIEAVLLQNHLTFVLRWGGTTSEDLIVARNFVLKKLQILEDNQA